jgi:hypothetical protein
MLDEYADEGGGLTTGTGFLLAVLLREAGLGDLALRAFLLIALGFLATLAVFRADPKRPEVRCTFALAVAFTPLISPH